MRGHHPICQKTTPYPNPLTITLSWSSPMKMILEVCIFVSSLTTWSTTSLPSLDGQGKVTVLLVVVITFNLQKYFYTLKVMATPSKVSRNHLPIYYTPDMNCCQFYLFLYKVCNIRICYLEF